MTVWREPSEESVDVYPGLVVWDSRCAGAITIDRSRLPLNAITGTAVVHGWDEVERGWSPTEDYGFTERHLIDFLHYLLELRGEFARLLLMLANAERVESEREDEVLAPHGPLVNITPGDPDAVKLPPPWWQTPEISTPIVEQMRRCIAALGGEQ